MTIVTWLAPVAAGVVCGFLVAAVFAWRLDREDKTLAAVVHDELVGTVRWLRGGSR